MTAPRVSKIDCQSKAKLQILPDFGLLKHADLHVFPIQWQAGCAKHCEYCVAQKQPTKGRAEDLFALVAHAHEQFGATKFFVVDDCFGGDLSIRKNRNNLLKTLQILEDYNGSIGQKLSFSVQIGLETIDDTEILTAMNAAGADEIRVYFSYPYHFTEMVSQILWIKRFCKIHGMFMLAYPNKNKRQDSLTIQVEDLQRFIRLCQFDSIDVSLAVPIPGTDLRSRLREENRLFPLNIISWEYYDGKHPLYMPNDSTPEELYRTLQEVWVSYYGKNLHTKKHQAEFLGKLKRAQKALSKS